MAAPNPSLGASSYPQSTLFMRARRLAADGANQESIMAALASEFPGQPSKNHYANPAAIAVMERIRARQRERQRHEEHNKWRAGKGMPPLPADDEAPDEPDAAALAGVTNGRALLILCARYGVTIAYDDGDGALHLSRHIDTAGPLADAIRRFRPSLVKLLGPRVAS